MKRLLAAACLTTVLLAPTAHASHGTTTPVAHMVPGQKGFYHSRFAVPRQPIQIGPIPTNEGFTTAQVVAPWNTAAGWGLFKPVSAPAGAQQVHFRADVPATAAHGAWVQRILYPNLYVKSCIIHYDPARVGAPGIWTGLDRLGIAHELGHCLGFRDHLNYSSGTSPQCFSASAPHYSAYRGVMEYCNWFSATYRANAWFKAGDRCTLEHYRYGVAC